MQRSAGCNVGRHNGDKALPLANQRYNPNLGLNCQILLRIFFSIIRYRISISSITMASTTLNASCLCGNAKFQITLPNTSLPLDAHLCHCSICRRTHGTLCTFHARIPKPSSLEGMTGYKTSPDSKGTRYFCSKCGTQMCDGSDDNAKDWCISTGVVDKTEGIFEFKHHIFVPSTGDGGFSEFLPKIGDRALKYWEGHQEESRELTPAWKDSITKTADPEPKDDRLHAHCHCGGVSLYLSRPNYESSPAFKADFPDLPMPGPEPRDRQKEYEQNNWWIATSRSKFIAGNCACTSCRLGAGCEIVQWAFVPICFVTQADGSPCSRLFGTLKEYNSSDSTWRTFCGTCGASVFWQNMVHRPKVINIAVGLFDDESGARADGWFEWRTSKLSGFDDALNKDLAGSVKDGAKKWSEGMAAKGRE
jgi:hypothetical protein